METMVRTNDGFEIAETDMKLRGPGDIEGTRQSGLLDLKLADIIKDEKLLTYARLSAIETIDIDPELKSPENIPVKNYLSYLNKQTTNWGRIS